MHTDTIAAHYDKLALKRNKFLRKNRYYYLELLRRYRYMVPVGKKILEVGCATGDLLAGLKPSLGIGIDLSFQMVLIAREKFPGLQFQACGIGQLETDEKFDFIILSGTLGEVEDIQAFLESLKRFCTRDTRVIIEYYSYFWRSLLRFAEMIGDKMPQLEMNWLTGQDIHNFLQLSGYQSVTSDRSLLLPFYVPFFGILVNKFIARLPFFNALTLNHFIISRPLFEHTDARSVTILVPCRNEKGNIEPAVTRTPEFGRSQEFIFVEGWSQDGTYEEVERIIKKYPQKNIKLYKQPGKGKGDAVRFGFGKATGDVLMILDADLTVTPEDMPKFYQALLNNNGEFINGCRLIYPMEDDAMRFLNFCANKFFGMFFSWLLGQRFRDTLCGTKVMFRHHYEQLAANRHYFGDFDPFGDFDLIFGAVKMNLKVVEMPIRYKNRVYGSTQIQRFKHGLMLLRMCWHAMWKVKFI